MATAALATLYEEAPVHGWALPQRAPNVESLISFLRAAFSAGTAVAAFLSEDSFAGDARKADDASREMTWRRSGLICTTADYRVHQASTASDISNDRFALADLEWAPTLGAFAAAPPSVATPPRITAGLDDMRSHAKAATSPVCLPQSLNDSLAMPKTESAMHHGSQLDSDSEDDDFVVVSHPQAKLASASGIRPLFLSLDSLGDDAHGGNEAHDSVSPLPGSTRSISPDPSWALLDKPFASQTATPDSIGSPTHSGE